MSELINTIFIQTEIQEILSMLDGDAYPELYEFLSLEASRKEEAPEYAYSLANRILLLDRTQDLPTYVIDFVTELFEMAGEAGNADAWNDLGACYYDGSRGFEQSFKKAVKYYRRAAAEGSRQAQENLGYCYYYGRDMEVDYEQAFHYFALGAFDGHLISLYKIGDMYRNGYYVKKNEVEAFQIYMHCFEMLTEETEPYAAGPVFLRLGEMFLHGKGTEADPKNALIAFQKAELFLYNMVLDGQDMYRASLQKAIRGQEEARKSMEQSLPDPTWTIRD